MIMRTIHIALLLGLLPLGAVAQILPNFGEQRAGLSTLSFLKNDMNPRSLGIGGASIALSGDAMSIHTNPAGLAELEQISFATSNYFIGAGLNQALVAGVLPRKNRSSFGLSVNTLTSGAMEVRTEFQPYGTGQKVYATNLAAGLTYAKQLSDMFSFGLTMKYIYEQLAEYSNHTAAVDMGFLYKTDFRKLSFAVVVQNFSGNSSLNGDNLEVTFNRNSNAISLDNYTVPQVFKMGVSMVPLEREKYSLLVAFELNHPNDNAENYRFGAEFEYLKLLFLRAGYKLNVEGQPYPTFGFGLRHRVGAHPFQINYAANPTSFLGVQHSLSLLFSINKMDRN